MNDSQSSDAVRRKRPAARRPSPTEGAGDPVSGARAASPRGAEPSPGAESSPDAPAAVSAASSTPVASARAKRANARRSSAPPRPSSSAPPPPVEAPPPAPIPRARPVPTAAPHAQPVASAADGGGYVAPSAPYGLTGSHIAQHVRDASRLAARLAAVDALPPEHGSFLRRLVPFRTRPRSDEVDEFGLDTAYEASVRPLFEKMCNDYFRTQVDGMHHVPSNGRALLVCNHSGALPWDGIMLRTALRLHHKSRRELRWLVEDHVFHAPFLGTFVNRIGAVRACQENAERLLQREALVAVFPEGIKGIAKPYAERYKLQRFGRGGYVRLALRTGAPVLPVAIVGAEETYPLLYKVSAFSRAVGFPFIPVTPTFPWLGPLGIAPLPSRWRIAIGAPIREIARHDADAANDESLVHELNECVRASVRGLLDDALRRRGDRVYVG